MLIWHSVPVLLYKAIGLIGDINRIMANGEGGFAKPRFLVELLLIRRKIVMKFCDELFIRAHGQPRLFVQQR